MKWILWSFAGLVILILLIAAIGAMLPRGHVATRRASYRQPPEEIWRALTDVERHPSWRSDLKNVEMVNAGSGNLLWKETGDNGTITMERTEATPNRRLVGRIADTGLPYGGRWIYELEPAPGGSRLTITEEGEVYNPIFRFMSKFIFGHTKTMETYLKDLGAHFGEAVSPAP